MNRDRLTDLLRDPGPNLASADTEMRRLAVAATRNHPDLHPLLISLLSADPEPAVRRECAEVLGRSDPAPVAAVIQACDDPAPEVREAAVNALGEIRSPEALPRLLSAAADEDEDRLVRESAVAALGAIGDPGAVPLLLDLIAHGPPQIRRRCVPALTVFDGDGVEAALRQAARDRNPMVREAAEMVVGKHPWKGVE
jgi:HEAT repeat protein